MIDTRHISNRDRSAYGRAVLRKERFKPARLRRSQCTAGTEQLTDELIAAGYKGFTFLVCPLSGEVLNDEVTNN